MKWGWLAACVWLISGSALATVTPQPGGGDPRIQSIAYDPQQVVALKVAADFSLTLEFSPEERIESVAIGASSNWLVTPNKAADHLFIRAGGGAGVTDMTVITDARSYNFELRPSPAPDPTTAILIRFVYPSAIVGPTITPAAASFYRFSGDKFLHPLDMQDDGLATYITWKPQNPIPAIFIVEADGRRSLADGVVRDGRFVIDRIAEAFVFRLGDHEEHVRRYVRKARAP